MKNFDMDIINRPTVYRPNLILTNTVKKVFKQRYYFIEMLIYRYICPSTCQLCLGGSVISLAAIYDKDLILVKIPQ